MSTANTVCLIGQIGRKWDEKLPGATITPGYLIELYNASGTMKVRPHSTFNGIARKLFAIEDALQGNTIDDTYTTADGGPCFFLEALPGEVYNVLLKAGESVSKGDWAVSGGDGTVVKAASNFLANNLAVSTTLTSWTTAVAFSNGTVSIPANTLNAGDRVRIRGKVRLASTNSTDTFTGTVNWGATALITTEALNGTDNDVWLFDEVVTIRTAGASGTFTASGWSAFGVLGTATSRPFSTNSTAVDTTAAVSLTIKMACSVSSASNQAILEELTVERVGAGSVYASGLQPALLGQFEETLDLSLEASPDRVALLIV